MSDPAVRVDEAAFARRHGCPEHGFDALNTEAWIEAGIMVMRCTWTVNVERLDGVVAYDYRCSWFRWRRP